MQKISREGFSELVDGRNIDFLAAGIEVSPNGPWIAGGAIRRAMLNMSLDNADIDVFFASYEQFQEFIRRFRGRGATFLSANPTNTTFSLSRSGKTYKIQAVTLCYYQNVEELLESFDFTISQCAYDGTNYYFGDRALWDIGRRSLSLNRLSYGVSTVRRLIKYTDQGFRASNYVMRSILNAVVERPEVIEIDIDYSS